MTLFVKNRTAKMALRLAALAGMTAGLSACYTDFGLGYASDGYGSNNYDCDPYSQFDTYYGCDYGYGFSNIGYGGGWYDNFYYPGYGIFLFDNYGQRYNMRDNHRRYWGGQRFNWQREHYRGNRPNIGNQGGGYYPGGTRPDGGHHDWRGEGPRDGDHDGRRGDGRRDGHGDGTRDGRRDGPRDGRGNGNGGWQGGNAPAGAVGTPPVSNPDPGRGEGYGRGGRGRNTGGEPDMRDGVMGSREEARFERRENYTPQPRQAPQPIPQQAAPQDYGQPQQRSQPAPERRTARPEAREQRRSRGVDRGVDNTVEE